MNLYERDYKRAQARKDGLGLNRESSALAAFIKQTYQLFAASLLAGAAGAYVGVTTLVPLFVGAGIGAPLVILVVAIGLLFAMRACIHRTPLNLILLFAFTFLLGASLTPLLHNTLQMSGGDAIVAQAFALTAVAFGALSIFAMNTKRDFTTFGKALFIVLIVVICASLLNLFLQSGVFQLAISSAVAILFSFYVLYDTQNIVRGNYTHPIEGAVALYLDFLNMFQALLSILNITNRE